MRKITFIDIDCFVPSNVMEFKPVRFERIKSNDKDIGYVAWANNNEPHVEYLDNVSSRDIYEVTKKFFEREKAKTLKIISKKESENLFERVGLTCVGQVMYMNIISKLYTNR